MLINGKNFKDRIQNSFELFENHLNGQKDSYVHKQRVAAFDQFQESGLPTIKNEMWKYTNVGFLNSLDIRLNIEDDDTSLESGFVENCRIKGIDDYVVIVNGFYKEDLSDFDSELEIKNLKRAFEENPKDIEKHFNKYQKNTENVFASLNTALAFDGLFIKSKKNQDIQKPLQIIYISATESDTRFSQARNLFIAEQSSRFTIVETTHSVGKAKSLMNISSEIYVAKNADITQYKLQNESKQSISFNQTEVLQERDSRYTNYTFSLDGRFIRNDLGTTHNDENIDTNYYGFYLTTDRNFVDNHTMVDHAMPNCESNELYKGILTDMSTAVFNGKILVRPDAQKVNAYQSSKNILLTDRAKINAKPELEIYADDVKCSHGSSTGSIDQEALFYLQSRGMEKDKAMTLLLYAYAGEIIDKVTIPELKEHISNLVEQKLGD